MIKDRELSFETQLKIEFLPPNNGSKKCLEKSLVNINLPLSLLIHTYAGLRQKIKIKIH